MSAQLHPVITLAGLTITPVPPICREIGRLVDACRVPKTVQPRRRGLWEIRRFDINRETIGDAILRMSIGGYDHYTALLRVCDWALMSSLGAEVVMEDSARELRRHLPILLAARGRVLVSGLGLGCVVRGLLSKPDVEHVDVIEIDPVILELIGREFVGNDRVTLHYGDAETYTWPDSSRWDYAWHDVWSETEPLELVHVRLMNRYIDRCMWQGAWQLPRYIKRILPNWYLR